MLIDALQIVCPSCGARYEVPEARLAPGKRVKCARCAGYWVPIAPPPEPDPEPAYQPEPEPGPATAATAEAVPLVEPEVLPPAEPFRPPFAAMFDTATPAPVVRRHRLLWVGWAATVVVLLACLIAARQFKSDIEHAWPPSERLYDLF